MFNKRAKFYAILGVIIIINCAPINYFDRGNLSYRKRHFDEAIGYYCLYIKTHPDNPNVYYKRAFVYSKQEKYDKAIKDLTRAIELNPDIAGWYAYRGFLYFQEGKYKLFIKDLTKAIEIKPDYFLAYHNRAVAYYNLADCSNVLKDCENGLKIHTQKTYSTVYYSLLGLRSYCLGDYEKALKYYTKGLEVYPDFAGLYSRRGDVYYKLNKRELAIKDWEIAHSLNSTYPTFTFAKKIIGIQK